MRFPAGQLAVAEHAARELPELPVWYDGLGGFSRQHILDELGEEIGPYVVEEQVQCLSLDDVLAKHYVTHYDLIHIDAEGSDFEVLKQVDLQTHRPACILFEHKHLSATAKSAAIERLDSAGYELFNSGDDLLATLPMCQKT